VTLLRVATFNIHHGVGSDGILDLERVAATLETTSAQVVCLQEVDRHWGRRSGHADQAGWLARRLGMDHAYCAVIDADPFNPGGARRQYGVATLTAFPIQHSLRTLFHPPVAAGEQRGLLDIGVDVDGLPLRVLNTHLEVGSQSERLAQAAAIRDAVRDSPVHVLMLGDFNAEPSSQEIGLVTQDLIDAWAVAGVGRGLTFDAVTPHARIDYVLVPPSAEVRSAAVMATDASDHLPVVVEVVLNPDRQG
jgi:endonuclease/exonuclease/phosphatase family metal-dependent hydrolase